MIRLHGRSLATAVLARCLAANGVGYVLADPKAGQAHGPQYVCINDVALSLLRDLFPALFTKGSGPGLALQQREVIWADDPVPRRIKQEARLVDMGRLTDRLFTDLEGGAEGEGAQPRIEVNPPADPSSFICVGKRSMLVAHVELAQPLVPARSLMESLLDSWMFLAPCDGQSAVLQAVVAEAEQDPLRQVRAMLRQSSLIAPHVLQVTKVSVLPSAPGIRMPLATETACFVGGAGIRLDPVSGEGVPFAIRSAILAAAVLAHDGPAEQVRAHYTRRMLTSFLSHLSGCEAFYADAFSGDAAWRREIQLSRLVSSKLAQVLPAQGEDSFQFKLQGFRLVPQGDALGQGAVV